MKQINTRTLLQLCLPVLLLATVLVACNEAKDTSQKTENWYKEKVWLNGLALKPHVTINQQQFRAEYEVNKQAWDTAFAYLKNTDLNSLPVGRHPIDSNNVFALVTEGPAKNPDTAKWESHLVYIDIHHVISGKEKMAISPVDSAAVMTPYDSIKDIGFYTGKGEFHESGFNDFFIVFPPAAHYPGVKVDGYDTVKKIVIKIKKAT